MNESTQEQIKDANDILSRIMASSEPTDGLVARIMIERDAARDAEKDALIAELRMQRDENARSRSYCRDQEESQKVRAEQAEAALAAMTKEREHRYCPECGSTKIEEMNRGDRTELGHRFCRDCHQELFDSVDYTKCVRGKLAELASLREPVGSEEEREAMGCCSNEKRCQKYRDYEDCGHDEVLAHALRFKTAALKEAEAKIATLRTVAIIARGYADEIRPWNRGEYQALMRPELAKIAALEKKS